MHGIETLVDAVQRVFASAFNPRVTAYRATQAPQATARMAVLVQRMIAADATGVAFTANPVTGELAEKCISAVRGSGERLVSGQATPDEWIVRNQEAMCGATPEEAINANQVLAVAELARRVEAHFGGISQDIEWALVGDELFLLQARPITALPEPVIWKASLPGAWARHIRLGEWLGDPVTPLFESWGLPRIEDRHRRQHPAARWCPGPPTDAHARQRLVFLLAQLSPVESRQHTLEAPALCIAEGTGPAAPGSHDNAFYRKVRCRGIRA